MAEIPRICPSQRADAPSHWDSSFLRVSWINCDSKLILLAFPFATFAAAACGTLILARPLPTRALPPPRAPTPLPPPRAPTPPPPSRPRPLPLPLPLLRVRLAGVDLSSTSRLTSSLYFGFFPLASRPNGTLLSPTGNAPVSDADASSPSAWLPTLLERDRDGASLLVLAVAEGPSSA